MSWEGFRTWLYAVRDESVLWLSKVGSVDLHRPSRDLRTDLGEQGSARSVVIRTGSNFALAEAVLINPPQINRFSEFVILSLKAGCLGGTCD